MRIALNRGIVSVERLGSLRTAGNAIAFLLLAALLPACSRSGIAIAYSPNWDRACSVVRGPPIREAWRDELVGRIGEFRDQWAQVGPAMLESASAASGLAMPRNATVRLTLCNIPSQSLVGTSVNLRFALASFTKEPVPMRYKVNTMFHELLHEGLDGKIPRRSPLLAMLASESACVRNHVHLLALQKAVLSERGDEKALADVKRIDSELPGGCYARAWALVEATPTQFSAYVAELRP